MNPKLEKLRAERKKLKTRYDLLGVKIKALDEQILKLENTDIVGIIRENGVSVEQLQELMALIRKNPTAAMPAHLVKTEGTKDEK
jgi:hypothetical protein